MKISKWFGVFLAAAAVLTLSACGNSAQKETTVKLGIVGSDKGGVWKTVAGNLKKNRAST